MKKNCISVASRVRIICYEENKIAFNRRDILFCFYEWVWTELREVVGINMQDFMQRTILLNSFNDDTKSLSWHNKWINVSTTTFFRAMEFHSGLFYSVPIVNEPICHHNSKKKTENTAILKVSIKNIENRLNLKGFWCGIFRNSHPSGNRLRKQNRVRKKTDSRFSFSPADSYIICLTRIFCYVSEYRIESDNSCADFYANS